MSNNQHVIVLITTPTDQEAQKISRLLLDKKKAACVNTVPSIVSGYWWQGKIESGQESLLIVKTKASLLPQIIELVKSVHSYEVPEIIALPVIGGNPDYLNWIDQSIED